MDEKTLKKLWHDTQDQDTEIHNLVTIASAKRKKILISLSFFQFRKFLFFDFFGFKYYFGCVCHFIESKQ